MAKHRPSSPRPRRRAVRQHRAPKTPFTCPVVALAILACLAGVPTVLILAAWHIA